MIKLIENERKVVISNKICLKIKNKQERMRNCIECNDFDKCNELVKQNQEKIIRKLSLMNKYRS